MSQRQKSFLSRLSLYNWTIGLKLNVLVYILLIISFTAITIVGFSFLEKYSEKLTYQKLEQITYQKKIILEKEYKTFLGETKRLFSDDLLYSINELKAAYKDYSYERGDQFNPDTISVNKLLLTDYYEEEILGNIEWNKPDIEDVFPSRDIEVVLQQTYLANNKWPLGQKDKLVNPKTGTSYDSYHQTIHTEFRSFARSHKINNIYLIDNESGDVIYNFDKNIAFGTNLFDGKFRTSELSRIFQEALSSTSKDGKLFFTDYSNFSAEFNKPVSYIAQTLFLYNEKVAVAVIELSPAYFESLIVDPWLSQNWESVEVNLIGKDKKLRMNEIRQYTATQEYFNTLTRKGIRNDDLQKASLLKGGAYVLGFKGELSSSNSKLNLVENSLDEKIYLLDIPLKIQGLEWTIVGFTRVDKYNELLASARRRLMVVYVLLLILATFTLRGVIKSMINRLNKLSQAFISLSKGEKTEVLDTSWGDELGKSMGVFNELNKRVSSVGELALKLSEGKYNNQFQASSEKDVLANALNTLDESLVQDRIKSELREKEDEKTKWLNEGVAKFNDLLRQSNNDIKELAFIVIESLVAYLDAVQGGVFLVEGDSSANRHISQIAAFAYDRRKYNEKRVEIGEGLLGNCYLEKKSIHLNKLPEDYLEVTSGLGSTRPKTLYIVPLKMDDNILGFIEIASMNELEEHHVEFIEKLSENIAATFSTVKLNTQTAELLEESKRRANEIAQQEEEMRQNMEEMQATQEELARLREEDERRTEELQNQIGVASSMLQTLIDTMPGEVIVKDNHGVVVIANEEACKRYNTTIEAVKGMLDGELLDKTILEAEHELDAEVTREGEYIGYRTENVNGSLVEYVIEKRTFYLKGKNETGIITIWKKADKGEA